MLRYLPIRVGGFLIVGSVVAGFTGFTTPAIAVLLVILVITLSNISKYRRCWAIHNRLLSRPGSNYEQFYQTALAEKRIEMLIDGHYAVVKREFRNWLPE